jgi:hypothetical protein
MTPESENEEAVARIESGVRGRPLIVEGWFACHADHGTPGPHIHLRTSDTGEMVIRTDQIPDLIEALSLVAERIERLWEADGAEYTEEVLSHSADPYDPDVIRQRTIRELDFLDRVAAHGPELIQRLTDADSTDEALDAAILLLDVNEVDAFRLARFDLLTLTRASSEARAKKLAELREPDVPSP